MSQEWPATVDRTAGRGWNGWMRVLVTGAAGFVGTATVAQLSGEHWLRCADLRAMPAPENGESVVADLTRFADTEALVEGMDAVVHLAFAHPGNPPYSSPEQPMVGTVAATANLFHAAALAGITRFVLMSSGAVVTGYSRDTDIHVGLPHRYQGLYPLSKSLQERIAEQYAAEYGMDVVALRPWSVVDGPTASHTDGTALRRDDPSWFGFLCRYDLAEVVRLGLTASVSGFQPYHLMATPAGRASFDVDRTTRDLGWSPRTTFETL